MLTLPLFSPQFRHKVRFEGLELPPSRSSSTSDCRSLCLPPLDGPPTPDSVDGGSEASWCPASSSPCSLTEAPGMGLGLGLGLGLGPSVVVGSGSWREQAETEASLKRLLPTLDALLQQLDRVTAAAEDLYHAENRLEQERRARRQGEVGDRDEEKAAWKERKKRGGKEAKQKGSRKVKRKEPAKDCGKNTAAAQLRKTPAAATAKSRPVPPGPAHAHPGSQSSASVHPPPAPEEPQTPVSESSPAFEALPTHRTPEPGPSHSSTLPPPPFTCDWDPLPPSSSLFNHPAHTTTIPTRKRKRKPPPLKNKVHPNLDHHGKS